MRAVLDIHGIEYFQALHFLAQLFPSVKHRGIFLEIPKLSIQEIVEVEHLKKSFFILIRPDELKLTSSVPIYI